MFDREDPKILWVSPDSAESIGTYDKPFSSLASALKRVAPGETIILKRGIYSEDQTIEISGNAKMPIQICVETPGEVIIEGACWYFYDTSDLIISGMIFKNAPFGAISVVGNCRRNRFHSLQFINCGLSGKASCTFYFGGAGGRFNLVEDCDFSRTEARNSSSVTAENASIALMVSEGDNQGGNPLKNHLFRRNKFSRYDYAILLGSNDSSDLESGHIVEYNHIEHCATDGIVVKCGDAQVRGNLIQNSRNAILMSSGNCSTVENNRILDSLTGINVYGTGHTVYNNCLVRCTEAAVTANCDSERMNAASNLFIQENTIVDCGVSENGCALCLEQDTSGIIQKNLIYGSENLFKGTKCETSGPCKEPQFVIDDNLASGILQQCTGVTLSQVSFKDLSQDDYSNESGYGAQGWMLTPEAFDPLGDELPDDEVDYVEASVLEDDEGELVIPDDGDGDNIFGSFYRDMLDQLN